MTLPKTVSIAMATYNGARFIEEQLASLTRQTVLPDELVVTDDASTDATADIVAAFAAKAPFPVRLERNSERLGYRANFMKAAGLCRSELIAFSDQDDVWLPSKLAACLASFESEDVLLTYHNATVVTETLEPIGSLVDRAAPQPLNPPHSIEPWRYGLGFTLVFRRVLLDFADYWPSSIDFNSPANPEAHDQWFCFLASSLGTISYIREPLVLYRQHGASIYGWGSSKNNIRGMINNLMLTDRDGLHSRELASGKRAVILDQVQKSLEGSFRQRASLAAAGYAKLEKDYHVRQQIYLSNSILFRLDQCVALWWSGGYCSPGKWGVGRKALARDILRGILFPPISASRAD